MPINVMKKYKSQPEILISGNVLLLCFPNHLSITIPYFSRAIPNLRGPLDTYKAPVPL